MNRSLHEAVKHSHSSYGQLIGCSAKSYDLPLISNILAKIVRKKPFVISRLLSSNLISVHQ